MTALSKQAIADKINQRRRQVLAHSILYYRFDASYVQDSDFDRWAHELADLQDRHPEISESVPYHSESFRGFTGDSGFDLPLTDVYAVRTAKKLLQQHENKIAVALANGEEARATGTE